MEGIRRLPVLRAWALTKLYGYRQAIDAMSPPLSETERAQLALTAIGAANAWAVLLRAYYLASMTGAVLADGSRASSQVSVRSISDALTFAVHTTRPRLAGSSGPWTYRDEPDWTDGGVVALLLTRAGASTASGFSAAVSLGTASRQQLTTYRNFVAHSNRDTATKVRTLAADLGLNRAVQPLEIPLQKAAHRPQSVLADWLDDLWAMASLMPK